MALLDQHQFPEDLKSFSYEELEQRIIDLEQETVRLKQVEIELKKSEEKFKILVETTSDWIWEIDAAGNFQYSSPRIYDLLGYTPEELVGKNAFDLMSPEEAAKVDAIYSNFVENAAPFSDMININLHKKGHEVVIESSGKPFFDCEGNLEGYRGIDRDITARTRVETALRESEARLNKMFSFSDYMVCIADLNIGQFIKVSPAFTKHLGWSEQEMLSKPILDFIHPEDVEKTAALIKEQAEKKINVIQFENRYKTKSGNYRWFEWQASTADEDNITYAAAYDITERKLAELALEKSRCSYFNSQR